jgi:hypothetical protein
MRRSLLAWLPLLPLAWVFIGCGSDGGAGGTTATSASAGAGGAGGADTTASGMGGDLTTVGVGGAGQGGSPPTDVCVGIECPDDQHCEDVMGVGTCVNNTCEELMCSATEECQTTPGGGALCVDISCTTDAECPESQYCDGSVCQDDTCVPGVRSCVGETVFECSANGFANIVQYTCGSDAYFLSTCIEDGAGDAYCGCEDDWDCPAYTVCDSGKCTGTGKAPTCSLPPTDFASALPVNEIQWGGTGSGVNNPAVGAPFPSSSQSSMVPLVANLDDDNGDGKIDEQDFPEIIFTTYCNTDFSTNGIVRAIHGGGPNKGKDFFATCGGTVWHEGDDLAMVCACATAEANSTAVLAVGDLDGDGKPEIVVPNESSGFTILDNTGVQILTVTSEWSSYTDPAVTLANLDGKGFAEIIVGKDVFQLEDDANGVLSVVNRFDGALNKGANSQGPVSCVANVAGGMEQEVIAGSTVYRMPDPPPGITKQSECPVGAVDAFCTKALTVVWDGQAVNGAAALPNTQKDGFCAIADILGTDPVAAPSPQNPLDGKPEVIVIAEGYLTIFEGETGILRRFTDLKSGNDGGAPNVDDFDGDGFPEIGSAFGSAYQMLDLQVVSASCPAWPTAYTDAGSGLQGNPARDPGGACAQDADCNAGAVCNKTLSQCVCLHNGWSRVTEDDSSRVTSSSVFDFNGDGAAEVIYNDECYFRIYDGLTANVLFKHNSPSRTRIENPAIADVDNDGNAEIVFPSNNDSTACSAGSDYPNGIAVWGDASDSWVSARRVWNQHAYHVTNVTEGGQIPVQEPESWKSYDGRIYNTYRSNPRNYNVAPDLTISGLQVASPDATCGALSDNLDITAEVANQGDLRVGPGVALTYYGEWTAAGLTAPLYADQAMTPLTAVLQTSLEPGDSILVSASYSASNNAPGVLPDKVQVIVDEANAAAECFELNNDATILVDPGMLLADLVLSLGDPNASACPMPTVPTTLMNQGSASASNIVVRYFAGDPNQGGTFLVDAIVAGPLDPGQSTTFDAVIPALPNSLPTLIYGVADPDDLIPECKDGNNKAAAIDKVTCSQVN